MREPLVFILVIQRKNNAYLKQEYEDIEHEYIQEPAIIDVGGQLLCVEQVHAQVPHHINHVYYLVSLAPQFYIRLLRQLVGIHAHFQSLLNHIVLLFNLFLSV